MWLVATVWTGELQRMGERGKKMGGQKKDGEQVPGVTHLGTVQEEHREAFLHRTLPLTQRVSQEESGKLWISPFHL